MKKVFIPIDFFHFEREQELSPLVRPFYFEGEWKISSINIQRWLNSDEWQLTMEWQLAEMILFPGHAHYYFRNGNKAWLSDICSNAHKLCIPSYLVVAGDFGESFEDIPGLIYLRQGGFANQLSNENKGFPFMLSDHMLRLFGTEDIDAKEWDNKPLIGFCGHALNSNLKATKEKLKFVIENLRRFFQNPKRRDYEILFSSALERWKILKNLDKIPFFKTNFIFRNNYRAGAISLGQREKSTYEYYQNIRDSQYILCIRGGGNFSVRLYETLMMGRIPIFVNTDCLLPFPEIIPWKEHMVWIEWKERHLIAEKLLQFHHSIGPENFLKLQLRNRQLWKEKLSLETILTYLSTNPYSSKNRSKLNN